MLENFETIRVPYGDLIDIKDNNVVKMTICIDLTAVLNLREIGMEVKPAQAIASAISRHIAKKIEESLDQRVNPKS